MRSIRRLLNASHQKPCNRAAAQALGLDDGAGGDSRPAGHAHAGAGAVRVRGGNGSGARADAPARPLRPDSASGALERVRMRQRASNMRVSKCQAALLS